MSAVDPPPVLDRLDNTTKALALARLGVKVFPFSRATRAPLLPRGFYDAVSDDFELIATWFALDFPEASTEVGVWTGGSGLLGLDIDKGKKNGKNGFKSIKDAGRHSEITPTEHYSTTSGGQHHIWQTDRLDLTLGQDVLGMEGVDIRAGGSYLVWWGNTVPESRDAFSTEIPDWVIEGALPVADTFTGEGFSGDVNDWLEAIPDDVLPSGRVRDFMARIPNADFGHPDMVDLAWSIVRMGSERETGVKTALGALRAAWLRGKYDTPQYRRDFDLALRGAINKAGRVQNPVPPVATLGPSLKKAAAAGAAEELKALERKVSETGTEIEFSRARKEMFKIAAEAGLSPSTALGIVTGSKAFKNSKAGLDSAWFGDGEPQFQDKAAVDEIEEEAAVAAEQQKIAGAIEAAEKLVTLSTDAQAFTFLSAAEQVRADGYEWWGKDYLEFAKDRLKHFNQPYHVGTMWTALSVIASPWGKVAPQGGRPTDCNLYNVSLGESTSGKSESWQFGTDMIDAYYGTDNSPIIGDIGKLSAMALHRQLILRDGNPSLVYGDEIQSFFQGVQTSQWQNGILGDISSHYGGDVSPKLTLNDKEISGKRAKTIFTTYLTGIDTQMLDAIGITQWTNGLFYRYLWSFGQPRQKNDFVINFSTAKADYTKQFEEWAREFKRVGALQEVRWGEGRIVEWDEAARERLGNFSRQIDDAVKLTMLYDTVYISANVRFLTSIMKCATLVAMSEASERVTLNHLLVALKFAGPWHRSMVLAVSETAKEPFDREVERCLLWIRRNAIRQVGKAAYIQRSTVMRAFKPNEIAERLLRQLTEEGWLVKTGDIYQLSEE